MAISAGAVAYTVAGALIAYSGIKGASLADTAKSLLSGNLNLSDTETVNFGSSNSSSSGSSSSASSGSSSANYLTIAKYLVANGYTAIAAAGIVGCVAGESSGNPESVGAGSYGIIQEQGSQYASLVTGDASKDLDTQLAALIAYNNAQGSGLIAMLNAQTSPVAAADFYSQYFERPLVKDSDVVSSVATSVYAQLTSGTTAITGNNPGALK
jgi:hypothetical protein